MPDGCYIYLPLTTELTVGSLETTQQGDELMKCIPYLVLIAMLSVATTAFAGANDGPMKNGLTAYHLGPGDAGRVNFELWLIDESVVSLRDYDLKVRVDGELTDVRVKTLQGYHNCKSKAQRYQGSVLVHPGQVRISNLTITGRQPYYIADSVNMSVTIAAGETLTVRQPVTESLLVHLDGVGKIRVGDEILISRVRVCPEPNYGLAEPPRRVSRQFRSAHRDVEEETDLCEDIVVPTASSRHNKSNSKNVWVQPGEQITVLAPKNVTCRALDETGYRYADDIPPSQYKPCEVIWDGPMVGWYQHGIEHCGANEHVICHVEGTSEVVGEPSCEKISRSTNNEEEDGTASFRVTAEGDNEDYSVGVTSGYSFAAKYNTTVNYIDED